MAATLLIAAPGLATADSGLTGSAVPNGSSVWTKGRDGNHQMLRLWRSGSELRIYRDDGGYPGDGRFCAWGTVRGNTFVGKELRVAPDPLAVRYTFVKESGKLTVLRLTGWKPEDRRPWRRSTVKKFRAWVPEAPGAGQWCRTYQP